MVVLLSVMALLFVVMYDLVYTDDKEFRTDSMNPKISSFEEDTYVVWVEANNSEFFNVYLKKITDGNMLEEPINLTEGTSFYPRPQILASENNVYVLWEDRINGHGDYGDSTYFKKSNDYGQTFDETVVLGSSSINSISYTPIAMEEANGIFYVFMFQWDPQTDEKTIVFRSSQDNGNTFGKPESFFEFDKKWASLFDTVSVNGTIYAVSADEHGYSDESGKISFRKIYPDGKLSDVINLNKTGYFVNYLDVFVPKDDGNDVYVVSMEIDGERKPYSGLVLEEHSLFFTKSSDVGNMFEKPIKLSTNEVKVQSILVNSHDDDINIMWKEEYFDGQNSSYKTWHAKSSNRGDTFDIAIHPLDELRSKYGKVYAYDDNDTLYFIIVSKIQSFYEDGTMYFVKSDDGGLTISKIIDVAGGPLPIVDAPKVSIHENQIQIVSEVVHEKNCILYISSDDGGESFSEPVNLSPNGVLEDCFVK